MVLVAHPLGAAILPAELEGPGFQLLGTADADVAFGAAAIGQADVAIVDSGFDGDGLAFCLRVWGARPGFPVLVLGPDDESALTAALSAGADDYLVLPLRPAEVVARVRAVLRRAPNGSAPVEVGEDDWMQVGAVRLNPSGHVVTLRSQPVHLPLREFQLLRLLMENAGRAIPKAALVSRLWGTGAPSESTSLEVHIRRLRSKLEDDPADPKRIVTVRGIGYRYQTERRAGGAATATAPPRAAPRAGTGASESSLAPGPVVS